VAKLLNPINETYFGKDAKMDVFSLHLCLSSNFAIISPAALVTSRAMMFVYRKYMFVKVHLIMHCLHGLSFTSHDVSDKSVQNFDMVTVF
jgi:hypothetical protein